MESSLNSIWLAAGKLRMNLNSDSLTKQQAVQGLLDQVQQYDTTLLQQSHFVPDTRGGVPTPGGPTMESVLMDVSREVAVANVLIAAGGALGEEGNAHTEFFDNALNGLRETEQASNLPSAMSGTSDALGSRHFSPDRIQGREPDPDKDISSDPSLTPDIPSPASTPHRFQERAGALLDTCTKEALKVTESTLAGARKFDISKMLEALEDLGNLILDINQAVEDVIRLGVEKLKRAAKALQDMLNNETLQEWREEIKTFVTKLLGFDDKTSASLKEQIAGRILGVPSVREQVATAVNHPHLDKNKLEQALREIETLDGDFKRAIHPLTLIVTLTAPAGVLLTPIFPYALPIVFGIYALTLAAVILISRDYVGVKGLNRVHGVGEIAAELINGKY